MQEQLGGDGERRIWMQDRATEKKCQREDGEEVPTRRWSHYVNSESGMERM